MAEGSSDSLIPEGAKCQNCLQEEELAIAYCKACKRLLCDECLGSHKRQRDTANHEVELSDKANEIRSRYTCERHKKQPLNFFCVDCDKPICDHCSRRNCKDHQVKVIGDVQEEIDEILRSVKDREKEFASHAEHVRSVSEKNKTSFIFCEDEITKAFETVVSLLQVRKDELIQQLKAVTDKNDEHVATHDSDILAKLNELKKTIQNAELLKDLAKEAKVMVGRKEMLASLHRVAAYKWDTESVRPRGWQLKAKLAQEYAQEFGNLIPKPYAIDIIVDGLEEPPLVGTTNMFTIKLKPHTADDHTANSDISVKLTQTPAGTSENAKIEANLKREGEHMWTVSYFLRKTGELRIAVSVCSIDAHGSPFTIPVDRTLELSVGTSIVRGPDWKWGGQDGGEGSKGEIVEVKPNGWVIVKWDNNKHKSFDYRWGAQGCFDLAVAA